MVKKTIFCLQKQIKMEFPYWKSIENLFSLEIFNLKDFWKQKMDFLTMGKNFVLDNFNIVLDKKYFVRADGRGIILSFCIHVFIIVLRMYSGLQKNSSFAQFTLQTW